MDLLKLRELLTTIGEPIDDKTVEFYYQVLFPAAQSMDDKKENDVGTERDCEEQQKPQLIGIDEFAEKLG